MKIYDINTTYRLPSDFQYSIAPVGERCDVIGAKRDKCDDAGVGLFIDKNDLIS